MVDCQWLNGVMVDLHTKLPGESPPYGTQFFRFHIDFHRKAPASEVHAPQKWVNAPPQEILDPPLQWLNGRCSMVQWSQPTPFRPLAQTSGHGLWPCLY